MRILTNATTLFYCVIIALLVSCSGGETGTGADDNKDIVSVGTITGFGSVFVNGVKFDTADAEISVNHQVATEDELSVGMMVAVFGSIDKDNQPFGNANRIVYECEVKGIVFAKNMDGSLNVMGQTIIYDDDTQFDSEVAAINTIAAIGKDAIVEISGYPSNQGMVHATRIRLISLADEGEEVHLNGVVRLAQGVNSADASFMIGELEVVHDQSTEFKNMTDADLQDGVRVKIKSQRKLNNTNQLQADTIELKKPFGSEGEAVRVDMEGLVSEPNIMEGEFFLNGIKVIFDSATKFKFGDSTDLIEGAKVEAEGYFDIDMQLLADEIAIKKPGNVDLTANVTQVFIDENQVEILGVRVAIDSFTLMKDQNRSTRIRNFDITDVNVADRIRIKSKKKTASNLLATQFRRLEVASMDNSVSLKGELEEVAVDNAVISGISVDISNMVEPPLVEEIGNIISIDGTFDGNRMIAAGRM